MYPIIFLSPQPDKTSYQNASNCHPYFSSVKIQQIKTATKFQSKQLANTLHTILTAERYSISTPHPIFRHFSDIQLIKFHLLYESTKNPPLIYPRKTQPLVLLISCGSVDQFYRMCFSGFKVGR